MIKYENSTLKIYIRNISKITQFDIIQSKLATTTIKKKYLMLIYEITILNIALINFIMIGNN
jgi:hypothetical protein